MAPTNPSDSPLQHAHTTTDHPTQIVRAVRSHSAPNFIRSPISSSMPVSFWASSTCPFTEDTCASAETRVPTRETLEMIQDRTVLGMVHPEIAVDGINATTYAYAETVLVFCELLSNNVDMLWAGPTVQCCLPPVAAMVMHCSARPPVRSIAQAKSDTAVWSDFFAAEVAMSEPHDVEWLRDGNLAIAHRNGLSVINPLTRELLGHRMFPLTNDDAGVLSVCEMSNGRIVVCTSVQGRGRQPRELLLIEAEYPDLPIVQTVAHDVTRARICESSPGELMISEFSANRVVFINPETGSKTRAPISISNPVYIAPVGGSRVVVTKNDGMYEVNLNDASIKNLNRKDDSRGVCYLGDGLVARASNHQETVDVVQAKDGKVVGSFLGLGLGKFPFGMSYHADTRQLAVADNKNHRVVICSMFEAKFGEPVAPDPVECQENL